MNLSHSLFRAVAPASLLVACFATAYAAPKTHDTELDLNRGAQRLMVQTEFSPASYIGVAPRQVTAGTITVPADQTGILVARFTAESNCSGGAVGQWCAISLVCDGVELFPQTNIDFAFNTVTSSAAIDFKSLSVARRSNLLTGGTHVCEVFNLNSAAGVTHRLDDWLFEVQFWRQ